MKAVYEPIVCCAATAPAAEIARLMTERDFDVAGVQSGEGGPVEGFVGLAALTSGCVADHMTPLRPSHLIADSTPLALLLKILETQEYIFVLSASTVSGIVTRADLNKPPVRIFLFGLLSLFEMHMGYWIRDEYGEDWAEHVSPNRLEAAKNFHQERKRRNQELELLDCLQFSDKRQLFTKSEAIRSRLKIASKTSGDKMLNCAETIRNNLAHSHDDLTKGADWNTVIATATWVEDVLTASDALLESKSQAIARGQ